MAVDPAADSEAIMAIVQPALDTLATELLKAIADVKALIPTQEADGTEEVAPTQQAMSAIERFTQFREFDKNN
jgi:hypothetical protein